MVEKYMITPEEAKPIRFGLSIVPRLLMSQYSTISPILEQFKMLHDVEIITVRLVKRELKTDPDNLDLIAIRRFQKNLDRYSQLKKVERRLSKPDLKHRKRIALLTDQSRLQTLLFNP